MEYFQRHLFLLLVLLTTLLSSSQALKYYVGGSGSWVPNPSQNYNEWAGRNRFLVNDTLFFKYNKGSDLGSSDSVLEVKKEDYDKCNKSNPLKKFEDGDTEFTFDRTGPFYFISGKDGNCEKNQKLIAVVLSQGGSQTPSPSPSKSPPPLPPSTPPPASPLSPSGNPPPLASPPSPSGNPPSPSISPAPSSNPPSPSISPVPASNPPSTSPSLAGPVSGPPAPSPSTSLAPAGSSPSPSPGTTPPPSSPAISPPAGAWAVTPSKWLVFLVTVVVGAATFLR